jgi:hypothetical protein
MNTASRAGVWRRLLLLETWAVDPRERGYHRLRAPSLDRATKVGVVLGAPRSAVTRPRRGAKSPFIRGSNEVCGRFQGSSGKELHHPAG